MSDSSSFTRSAGALMDDKLRERVRDSLSLDERQRLHQHLAEALVQVTPGWSRYRRALSRAQAPGAGPTTMPWLATQRCDEEHRPRRLLCWSNAATQATPAAAGSSPAVARTHRGTLWPGSAE